MNKLWAVVFNRCQRGWECTVTFTVTTAGQFTDETDCATAYGGWWLTAFWRARRAAAEKAERLRAKPGERVAKGWGD